MLDRDRVTAYLPGWPRSAAMRAALVVKKSGRPSRSDLSRSRSQSFSSASTFWPNSSRKRRQPLGDRGQPRLGFGRGGRAGAGEIEMIALEHARLLRREPELRLLRFKRVDAREQSLVQVGFAAMAREHRRNFALDRLQFVIGVGAGQIEKNTRHSVEPAPAALERLDRIGEARRRRIGGDDVDLRSRLAERGLEGRPEMARLEAVERRRLERPGPGLEQRVRIDRRTGHER